MAYKTEDLLSLALEAIGKYRLIFIEEVVSYLPCVKQTFYDHGLDKSDELKEAIQKNKDQIKSSLRKKWYASDNPTLQMALYKLTATDQERKALSMTHTDVTTNGEAIGHLQYEIVKGTKQNDGDKND